MSDPTVDPHGDNGDKDKKDKGADWRPGEKELVQRQTDALEAMADALARIDEKLPTAPDEPDAAPKPAG
jgi:hypothetical protein